MKRLFIILFPILMLLFSQTAFTQAETNASPQLVVHLLDYLAKDYGGAVQNGKIISESEYSEQVEFSEIVGKNSDTFPALKSDGAFMTGIRQLQSLIKSKGSAEEVAALARKLQQQAILLAKIDVAPSTIPDLQSGASLYQANCVACHGATGHGDGAAGATLDPKPANFHDPELVLNSAPYKFYNTIRLGVPGTGMASFSNLSDKEVWALAFYIKSLAHKNDLSVELPKIDLKEAAVLTDKELIERVGGSHEQAKITVGSLRAQGFSAASEGPLDIAQSLLNKSIEAAENNNFALAKEFGLRAYLEGIEPLEPKMKANIPGFVEEIEALMSGYRSMLEKNESISKLKAQRAEIFGKLNEVKKIFSESKMSPSVAFGAAFSIFLREGFEAILIIIILISILRAMNQPDAIKWVHCGWISAVALGVAAWFA
ncbi:MAG: c-type cytochrome, partial [Pseudobdellovibrionaceae bacterium]